MSRNFFQHAPSLIKDLFISKAQHAQSKREQVNITALVVVALFL
jgi:hypothetical protein